MKCLISVVCICLSSCTIYTEKQSEALSRAVYATRDSFESARIDLADAFSAEAARIVKPPKKKITVKSIHTSEDVVVGTTDTGEPIIKQSNVRRVVVPERYKNDVVVVVNSKEYNELLKNKEIYQQLEVENESLLRFKDEVDKELTRQEQYNNKLIQDLNILQKKVVEKDLAILQRNIVILFLVGVMGAGVYLRMKGIL